MNAKECKEYKAMEIWKEELCRWCVASCKERAFDYDLAGKRWSLRVARRPASVVVGSMSAKRRSKKVP